MCTLSFFWWIKIYTYTQSRRYMYAFVKPGTHWRQSRPYRQHSWPSWRRCRPRQAVEFKLLPICRQNRQQSRPHRQQSWPYRRQSTLLPICRRFRQQSTLSPVCTGLQRSSFFRDVLLLLRAHPLINLSRHWRQRRHSISARSWASSPDTLLLKRWRRRRCPAAAATVGVTPRELPAISRSVLVYYHQRRRRVDKQPSFAIGNEVISSVCRHTCRHTKLGEFFERIKWRRRRQRRWK